MQLSVQMEGSKNGGSEQASSSDDVQLLVASRNLRKAVEASLQAMETSQNAQATSQEAMVGLQQARVELEQAILVILENWNRMVRAGSNIIDYKRMYLHYPSTESNMGIIFDAFGGLKGAVIESHYVPINNLSADKKDCAHKFLLSAIEKQKDITSFDDEASLLKRFPCRSGPGTPSQSIDPSIITFDLPNNISYFGVFDSQTIGQPYEAHSVVQIPSCQSLDLDSILDKLVGENRNLMSLLNPEINNRSQTLRAKSYSHLPKNIFHWDSLGSPNMGQLLYETTLDVPKIPSCKFSYPDFILGASGDNWRRMYVVKSEINKSETLRAESHSHQQSNSRFFRLVRLVVNVKLWVDRAKKRVLALEGLRVHKKQKIVRDLNLLADTASEVG